MASAETTALRLFRALLRAATYLPDELARTHIRNHIVHRFRNAARITPDRLRNARRSVSILQRAAEGDPKPLRKVLSMTYGRSGPMRRELLDRLRALEGDALQHFIRSQKANKALETERKPIKQLKLTMPKENIWGRPIPLKRQANIEKEFWSDTYEKLLPPLPERFWNRLRDLSTGVVTETLPKPRGIGQDRKRFEKHNLTPRYMRRMWASVWNESATMESMEGGKWKITWGGWRNSLSKGRISMARKQDLELFEGAEEAR